MNTRPHFTWRTTPQITCSTFCFVLVVTVTSNTFWMQRGSKPLCALYMIYSLLKSMQSFKTQLSENIGLISRHWLGARRRLSAKSPRCAPLSERCRRHSSHSSTDAADVRAARPWMQRSRTCRGGRAVEIRADWGSGMRRFWGEKYSFLLGCQHHPKCINRADEYPCW